MSIPKNVKLIQFHFRSQKQDKIIKNIWNNPENETPTHR